MSHHQHGNHTHDLDVRQQAHNALRSLGLRVTVARIEVLSLLLLQQRAMSHNEMQEGLPGTDRVTLYRALDCLTDAGLAHKIVGDDRITRFRSGAAHAHNDASGHHPHQHGHFQCLKCAKVFCLEQAPIAALIDSQIQASLRPGFTAQGVELTIKGWCDHCNDND